MMNKGLNGLDKVLKNLNKAVKEIVDDKTARLLDIGIQVRAEGQKETPVDTGNLINSWYGPTPFQTAKGPVVEIGLTADYAPYVHEMVDATFQKPGAKAKFLEDPLKKVSLRLFTYTMSTAEEAKEQRWWVNQL